jgi:hypothetical protein
MDAVLGMERQRELMGCADGSSSCIAELANALGAELVATGEIARLETRIQVNLKLIDARTGKACAVYSARVDSEEAVLDELQRGAEALVAGLKAAPVETPPAPAGPPRAHAFRAVSFIALVAGVLLEGAGAGLSVAANGESHVLTSPPGPVLRADAVTARDRGNLYQSLSVVGFVVGGVALAAWVVLFFL